MLNYCIRNIERKQQNSVKMYKFTNTLTQYKLIYITFYLLPTNTKCGQWERSVANESWGSEHSSAVSALKGHSAKKFSSYFTNPGENNSCFVWSDMKTRVFLDLIHKKNTVAVFDGNTGRELQFYGPATLTQGQSYEIASSDRSDRQCIRSISVNENISNKH